MKMKTALMIAGGVGLVGYLIYRANVAPSAAVPVPIPGVNQTPISAAAKAKLVTIAQVGAVQAVTASS